MLEMGKQAELLDIKKIKSEVDGFSQIKPEEGTTFQDAQNFWNGFIRSIMKENETSRTFDSLNSMKRETGKSNGELKENKPPNSPNISKWFEKGGLIRIEDIDGKQVWTYIDSVGREVPYIDKYPVFPPEAKHPVIDDINIGKFTGDRSEDKQLYLEKLEEQYGLTEIPEGYVLHHDSVNGNMQLIKSDWHKEFTHAGGHSLFKGES